MMSVALPSRSALAYLKTFTATSLKHISMYFDIMFSTVNAHGPAVMKGSVLGSRLRNDDTIWTFHFKLILTEALISPQMAGMKRTVIHISRPKAPQRDLGIKRYEPLN